MSSLASASALIHLHMPTHVPVFFLRITPARSLPFQLLVASVLNPITPARARDGGARGTKSARNSLCHTWCIIASDDV